ncbi:MAG: ABC transporter ATP-binding protein, partial [Betaproteobacteria bacterium]|nr:ABC transporter ATP-binding protein [Betaproteobacteria bacterium]
MVQLDQVSMAYGRGAAALKAIEEVSLEIAKGEFIAV